ncbi:hypothetical protein OG21DRAFT_878220 [Imleria badia]|nr:hypothetical protein OG21DRAFT_878220 [Imleria badia]
MVGANYMGGKRNTARAKSKDVVGRAQRRHFGKQRLASALCVTQENRIHPSAPTSSVLPEITLAHARCDAGTDSGSTSSRKVFSGDRLYSSTSPSNTTRRNKPSKVLGALDILDHVSMRAAIDRILQQPNLIGINTANRKDAVCIKRMQTPGEVGRPTDARFDSEDPDTQHPEIVSKRVVDAQVSHSHIERHEPTGLPESNSTTRYEATASGTLSPPDSPSARCDVTPWDAFDDTGYAEAQSFTATIPFIHTEGNELEWPNTFLDAVRLLPRSSPFPSSSQSSDNSVLDLDTSPWAAIRPGRSDDFYEEDVDCVDVSSLRSIHWPIFRQPIQGFPIREGSAGVDEAQFTTFSLEAERSRTTCCNDDPAFPSTRNHDLRHSSSSESGRGSIRVLTRGEDDASDFSIDFLSDPDPWETITKILKLKPPEPSAVRSVEINFTKDRNGVGYVSPESSGPSSSADPPILDSEVSTIDNHMPLDIPDSPCASDSTRPLLHAVPLVATRAEVVHMHALQDTPPIPVIHCAQDEHTRSPTPLAVIVGATAAEPDFDMVFDGPCLFGDSDLEEDE